MSNLPIQSNNNQFYDFNLKAEKLAAAIYMVSDYIASEEPLRAELRILALDFLLLEKELMLVENRLLISRIISLLQIGKTVGLVSEMNFNILSNEFLAYLNFLEQKVKMQTFSLDFLLDKEELPAPKNPEIYNGHDNNYKGHKGKSNGHVLYKNNSLSDMSNGMSDKNIVSNRVVAQQGSVERKSLILKIIKDKREITIKELRSLDNPLMKDCSEKTIQRELVSLIKAKKIKRIGSKKWTKYGIN